MMITQALRLGLASTFALALAAPASAQEDALGEDPGVFSVDEPLLSGEEPLEGDGLVDFDAVAPGADGVETPEYEELFEDVGGVDPGGQTIGDGIGDGGVVDAPEIEGLDADTSDLGRTSVGEIDAGPGEVRTPEVGEVLDDVRTPGADGFGVDIGADDPGIGEDL